MSLYLGALGLVLALNSSAFAITLDQAEYEEIKQIALGIRSSYPPEQFLVVGVGRSPTPITTFLEILHPGSTATFPISNFKFRLKNDPTRVSLFNGQNRALTPAEETKLFRHFDRYFPSTKLLAGRRLVLVDFTYTGDSLLSVAEYLQKYLMIRHLDLPFQLIGINDREKTYIEKKFNKNGFDIDVRTVKDNQGVSDVINQPRV